MGYRSEVVESPLQPRTILLKDGETIATMYPIPSMVELLPHGLLSFMVEEFNMEIEKGDSLPFYNTLTSDEFRKLLFQEDGHLCVMVLGEIPELDYSGGSSINDDEKENGSKNRLQRPAQSDLMRHTPQYKKRKEKRNLHMNIQWEKQCLGLFTVQSAFPGRSAHVVTGTFLVNAGIRGKGIGRTLVETFIDWSKKLGYTSSFFPLIYDTNVGMRRILEDLNFRKIGKLPESGILKGFDIPVDSFMYGKEFTHITKSIDLLRETQKTDDIGKYERLQYYLETGMYPENCDRNEKARLRVSARSHSVENGRLLNGSGKEVIYDPERQQQIALDTHVVEHQGINKVTTRIAEKYHWKGIKNTVTEVIAKCPKCKMRYPDGMGVIVTQDDNVPQAHMLPTHRINVVDKRDNVRRPSDEHTHVQDLRPSKKQRIDIPVETKLPDTTPPDSAHNVFNLTANTWAAKLAANIGFHGDDGEDHSLVNGDHHEQANTNDHDSGQSHEHEHEHEHEHDHNHTHDHDNSLIGDAHVPSSVLDRNDNGMSSLHDLDKDGSIMDAAMLSLEDNVIAALEIVRKEQKDEYYD
ncbi:Spt10p [Nakaseomyces bracarensis]|uniref:Spt10p n=1 Tax=Nakaseomyces bracarensis TaxID=273131 RepID=UPI0038711C95